MLQYQIIELFAWIIGGASLLYLMLKGNYLQQLCKGFKKSKKGIKTATLLVGLSIVFGFYASHPYPPNFALPPMMKSEAPGGLPASLPIINAFDFFRQYPSFEKVEDIGADPTAVPAPINRNHSEHIQIDLIAQEVISEVGDGIGFNYWTYNQQVPGPMFRVREGDTVTVSLTNHESSLHEHNIDLHSVTGPGGGGAVTKVQPGETKSFTWKALNPGLYVYHCATSNISTHNAHGQYGMILVEPEEGLPPVDKEFYVMQGELYTVGGLGVKGLTQFDSQALMDGIPSYITFNGKLQPDKFMEAEVGDTVRIYVGNGGLNLISSFHVIGEIFDKVYPEAAIGSDIHHNVQTTAVLPGGASIVEFTLEVPGSYTLVDHALARMNKGAWAVLSVTGEENPEVFEAHDMQAQEE